MDQELPPVKPVVPLESEDYYFEGPNLVFTAAYHLKRGSCCQSGCRHCPYGFEENRTHLVSPEDQSGNG